MLSDKEMITLMVTEPSWEDVIVRIVAEEGMDPWDIDIIRLSHSFSDYLKELEQSDLRVPARFILIAAILLRMKSDILIARKKKMLIPEGEKPEPAWMRALANLPPLQPPIKRIPVGSVSLNELVIALKKAFDVKERRTERKRRIKRMVDRAIPLVEEEDITDRIARLYTQIQEIILEIENDVEFSKLVKEWNREDIVKTLLPTLHLSQEGKINIEQKKLFEEIYIKMRKKKHKKEISKKPKTSEQES